MKDQVSAASAPQHVGPGSFAGTGSDCHVRPRAHQYHANSQTPALTAHATRLKVRPCPQPWALCLTSSLCAALEVQGKMLHLGDVCKMLRNSEDPKAVLQALQALQALLPARPEELSLYAGES